MRALVALELGLVWVGLLAWMGQAQQIIPDATLESESSIVILDSRGFEGISAIEGGARRGKNLFHSFTEFGIVREGGAYFHVPDVNIENIFARVTGDSRSEIYGTLGVIGFDGQLFSVKTDLFFLNPNGILFGPGSNLDLQGSFLGSTFDSVRFPNYSWSAEQSLPESNLLTIFGDPIEIATSKAPQNIEINDATFLLNDGQSFSLYGGEISLRNSLIGGMGAGSSIAISGMNEAGVAKIGANYKIDDLISTGSPDDLERSDIRIYDGSFIGTIGEGRGDVYLKGRDIKIQNNSLVFSNIFFPSDTEKTDNSSNIVIHATGNLLVENSSEIYSQVLQEFSNDTSNIFIIADTLSLDRGGQIYLSNLGEGNTGDINIDLKNQLFINGQNSEKDAGIFNQIGSTGIGESGKIEISALDVELKKGAQISNSLFGKGKSGDILIYADNILLNGVGDEGNSTSISGRVSRNSIGTSGSIILQSNSLLVEDGASLNITTFGQGNSGSLNINVRDRAIFKGVGSNQTIGGAFNQVAESAVGNGGEIRINVGSLEIKDGASLSGTTFGKGNGGNISITASDKVEINGAGPDKEISVLGSQVAKNAVGNGGQVDISARNIEILNGAQLSVGGTSLAASGENKTGSINIDAAEQVILSGRSSDGLRSGGIFNSIGPASFVRSGNINIAAHDFRIEKGARLSSRSASLAKSGDIFINANFVSLNSNANINSDSFISSSGNIRINAREKMSIADKSRISTDSTPMISTISQVLLRAALADAPLVVPDGEGGTFIVSETLKIPDGRSGSIVLNTPNLILEDSQILAESVTGKGGNILINQLPLINDNKIDFDKLNVLFLKNKSLISTTSGDGRTSGDGGNIAINSPFLISFPNENSDIVANAFSGTGGNITINADAILNFQLAEEPDLGKLRANTTNDISASSQLGNSGTLNLAGLNVDPSRGVAQLPVDLTDRTNQIDRSCAPQTTANNSFTVSGRNGLPLDPKEPQPLPLARQPWLPLPAEVALASPQLQSVTRSPFPAQATLPLEATAWQQDTQGRTILIAGIPASDSTAAPHCWAAAG